MSGLKIRKLFLYIATSLDGYIAAPGDNLDFLNIAEKEGEDYGYNDFISGVDTVILGRRTYEWVIRQVEFPHADKETYVITRTPRPPIDKITFYTGNLKELITSLTKKEGKNIFCDGGAQVIHTLLQDDLVDEIILSVVPTLIGDGIKLFKDGRPELKLELVSSKAYDTGLIQSQYRRLSV